MNERWHRLAVLALVLGAIMLAPVPQYGRVVGAQSATPTGAPQATPVPGPQTWHVLVNNVSPEGKHWSFNTFYPDELQAHPGDTIVFILAPNPQAFHTVQILTAWRLARTPLEFYQGYLGGIRQPDMARPGGAYRRYSSAEMKACGAPDVVLDGEVLECDPPRRLVQTWRMLMDPDNEPEGFTRLTYEIDPQDDGVCRLTLTHDLTNAPRLSLITDGSSEGEGGGGWPWVLSGLKTLLETGTPLQNRS